MTKSGSRGSRCAPISRLTIALAIVVLCGHLASAQGVDSTCTYARCALNIIPRLSGLAVVRGAGETRVGLLPFLWSHDIALVFARDAEARSFATRAIRRRRTAAAMTDIGAFVAAAGAIGVLHDSGRRRAAFGIAFAGGTAMIGASVPVHFAADADLSRAVWRYNSAFATTHCTPAGYPETLSTSGSTQLLSNNAFCGP